MVARTGAHAQPHRGVGLIAPSIASAAALAAGLLGIALAISLLRAHSSEITFVVSGEPAQAGGLSLSLEATEWLRHDMEPTSFPMPASMMTGMPAEGQQRLHVEMTLGNADDRSLAYTPGEFRLLSAGGTSWAPVGASFAEGSLRPGQAMNGGVFFDVPEGETELHLVWSRGGEEVHIPVAAGTPAHSEHGAAQEVAP